MSILPEQKAKKIVKMEPDEPIEMRLDGEYRVLSVQSDAVRSGFKATIENIEKRRTADYRYS